jgi:hypothetical protein
MGRARLVCALLTPLFVGGFAERAGAATIAFDTGAEEMHYRAAPAEANRLSVSGMGRTLVLSDPGARSIRLGRPPATGARCVRRSGTTVACTLRGSYLLMAALGDRDDAVRVLDRRGTTTFFDGGAGNDVMSGGSAHEQFRGGPGDDRLSGGGGTDGLYGDAGGDTLDGGGGYDSLFGGTGGDALNGGTSDDHLDGDSVGQRRRAKPARDILRGGPGEDTANYLRWEGGAPVTVTLDGRANDGAPGERDVLHADVEGASVDDRGVVIGNNGRNTISAGRGGTARGGGGDDDISVSGGTGVGGDGNDSMAGSGTLLGGPGRDRIGVGGRGRFYGGPGDDRLEKQSNDTDSPVGATLSGGPGDDRILSRDWFCDLSGAITECTAQLVRAPDDVRCGAGLDSVVFGAGDVLADDCERSREEQPVPPEGEPET